MNHENIKEKLLAFYDKELLEAERQELKEHVTSCQECAEILKRWEAASSALSKIKLPEESDFFVRRVMNRIDELERPVVPEPKVSWIPRWVAPVFGYGFAVILMILAISYREPAWSTEAVLIADMPQESQWMFSAEDPESTMFGK